ncbi:FRG domain-containing protein [Desulfonatronum lacustre]|uniref:FRG domain-containing protein n=1 Tax=Desulfonatronum lacustre TaxID=66849 RepID=UPI0004B702DB|nr:FRG domain-containing protein [Desulfonatronum lacustre]
MKLKPLFSSTKILSRTDEWAPVSFKEFVEEVEHVISHCKLLDHYLLFRGHGSASWLLDSTFARFVKQHILGINITETIIEDYRHSLDFYRLVSSLFLCKFGTLIKPSLELTHVADENPGIDPWFELMKRFQQYPEEDMSNLKGTFLLDWTQDWRVALYFANNGRNDQENGVLFLADMSQSGSVLHRDLMVGEIIGRLHEAFMNDQQFGPPLIFSPRKQITCDRAKQQDAIYVAQMDLRLDLSEYWRVLDQKRDDGSRILNRIYLPKDTKKEINEWLADQGVTERFIYPDKETTRTSACTGRRGACRP